MKRQLQLGRLFEGEKKEERKQERQRGNAPVIGLQVRADEKRNTFQRCTHLQTNHRKKKMFIFVFMFVFLLFPYGTLLNTRRERAVASRNQSCHNYIFFDYPNKKFIPKLPTKSRIGHENVSQRS